MEKFKTTKINLLSPQQLSLVDLREARAKVRRRMRIMHFVPYAISWMIMLWLAVCVGLWVCAMLAGCAWTRSVAAQEKRDRCVRNLGIPDMFSASPTEIEAFRIGMAQCEKK